MFGGCWVCSVGAEGPACRTLVGPSEATAETTAARRANSRREIPALVLPFIEVLSGFRRSYVSAQRTVLNPRLSVNLAFRPIHSLLFSLGFWRVDSTLSGRSRRCVPGRSFGDAVPPWRYDRSRRRHQKCVVFPDMLEDICSTRTIMELAEVCALEQSWGDLPANTLPDLHLGWRLFP